GLGRIGLNYAPSNPHIIYAQVEGNGNGGLYRSNDNGITWERRNNSDQQAQYYGKVVVDPGNPDRVYIMGVNIMVSDDGGRTLSSMGTRNKHVDNHDIWIDPKNENHSWWAAMAACTRASTAPPRGSSKRTCRPASSTTSPWTRTCRSITSTAARRITIAWAAPRATRTPS